MSPEASVALANHILFHQGVLDAFGHVSLRDPNDPETFLISRNLAPALVTDADIVRFDLDGRPRTEGAPASYLERYIHAAIYRVRPDVMSVVHSHAPSVLPFGVVSGAKLCPICHMAGFLKPRTPVFEIRDHGGDDTNLLIASLDLGRRLAECLGDHPVVLMRGHGMTVVGASVEQAVFRAVYTEANARIQAQAQALGTPTFLTDMEAAAADAANNGQIPRAWTFWALQARAALAGLHGLQATES